MGLSKVATLAFLALSAACSGPASEPPVSTDAHAPFSSNANAFPTVRDPGAVRIRLFRDACFGTCPVYSVEIRGDGAVTYCGENFVREMGIRTRQISTTEVEGLINRFREADFYSLRDRYVSGPPDHSSYVTSIMIDQHEKAVVNYLGQEDGLPAAVSALEDEIDRVAGTSEWIGTDATGIPDMSLGTKCPAFHAK